MGLLFRVFFMGVALAGIVYMMYQLNTKGLNQELFHMDQGEYSFSPSQVSSFEWKTRDKIASLEKDSHGQWVPFERGVRVQELLQQISQIDLHPLEQKSPGQIFLQLQIQKETWIGQWDGMSFMWTQGPFKGEGAVLSEGLNRLFFRGRFLFDPDVEVQICESPIQKIRITLRSQETVLEKGPLGWQTTQGKSISDLEDSRVESWIQQACQLKVATTLDPAYTPAVGIPVNRLTFYGADRTWDFFALESDLVMAEDRALILTGFRSLFKDISSEIQKTQP